MNKPKLTGLHKTISLVLVAIILILAIGFAASGWDGTQSDQDKNSGNVGDKTDNSEENKHPANNTQTPPATDSPNDLKKDPDPIYKNEITGATITQEEYETVPFAVVIDSSALPYGISNSDIIVEFPVEYGESRLLCYYSNKEILWKIGALKTTKNYISSMSSFFGGVVVSYGKDDSKYFDAWETDKIELDLSQYSDCFYVENTLYVYTTENMIEAAQNRLPLSTEISGYKNPPYKISDGEKILGVTNANKIIIPYSDNNTTDLRYDSYNGKYTYHKADKPATDMLTGENVAFTNVFVLFANALTYESINGTELNIDVITGGNGYYASSGMLTEFTWYTDSNGNLHFQNLMGDVLQINAGNVYIAYYKASCAMDIKIS